MLANTARSDTAGAAYDAALPLCPRCVDHEVLKVEKCWWWSLSETLVPQVGRGPMVGYTNVMPSLAAYTTQFKAQLATVPQLT